MTDINRAWLQWQDAAATLARAAGALLRNKLVEPRRVQSKGFRDFVTDADFAAQKLITTGIREQFPEHGFIAEEENPDLPSAGPVRWLIDPVDGTSNYSRNIPNFCVSIATTVDDEVVIGVIYDPMHDELFSAVRGQGCRLNGEPAQVSTTTTLADAIIALDLGRSDAIRGQSTTAMLQLVHNVRSIRTIGSAALTLAWVAAGRIDAHLAFQLSPWDIAAGTLLVTEAGGQATNAHHAPLSLNGPTSCATSNGRIHDPLLALIKTPS